MPILGQFNVSPVVKRAPNE